VEPQIIRKVRAPSNEFRRRRVHLQEKQQVAGWIDLRGYASLRRSGVVFAVFGLHDVSGPIEKIAVPPPAPDDCMMIGEDDQVVLNSPGARSSRGEAVMILRMSRTGR
jgi:hypothetical protein